MPRGASSQGLATTDETSAGYAEVHRLVDGSGLWISDVSLVPSDSAGALDLELSLCPAGSEDPYARGPVRPQIQATQANQRPPLPRPAASGGIRVVLKEESSYHQEAARIFLEHFADYAEVRSREPAGRRQAVADAPRGREGCAGNATVAHCRSDSYDFTESTNTRDRGVQHRGEGSREESQRPAVSCVCSGSRDGESCTNEAAPGVHGHTSTEGFGSFDAIEQRDDFCFPHRDPSSDRDSQFDLPRPSPAWSIDLPDAGLRPSHKEIGGRQLRKFLSSRQFHDNDLPRMQADKEPQVQRTMSQERRVMRPRLPIDPRTQRLINRSRQERPKICISSSQHLSIQDDLLLNDPGVWISDISLVPDDMSSEVRLEVAVVPSPRSRSPNHCRTSPPSNAVFHNDLRLGHAYEDDMQRQCQGQYPSMDLNSPTSLYSRAHWESPYNLSGRSVSPEPTLYTLTDDLVILPDPSYGHMSTCPSDEQELREDLITNMSRSKSCVERRRTHRPRAPPINFDADEVPMLYPSKTMPKRRTTPSTASSHVDTVADVLVASGYHHSPMSSGLSPTSTDCSRSSFWSSLATPNTATCFAPSDMSETSALPSPYWNSSSLAPTPDSSRLEQHSQMGSGRSAWQMQSPQWSSIAQVSGGEEKLSAAAAPLVDEADSSSYPSPFWNASMVPVSRLLPRNARSTGSRGRDCGEMPACVASCCCTCGQERDAEVPVEEGVRELILVEPEPVLQSASNGAIAEGTLVHEKVRVKRLFVTKKLGGSFSLPGDSDVRLSFSSVRSKDSMPQSGDEEGKRGVSGHERNLTLDLRQRSGEVRSRPRRASRRPGKDSALIEDMYAVFGGLHGGE